MPKDSFLENVACDLHPQRGGGYGDVYKATYEGKVVAIKSVRLHLQDRDKGPKHTQRMCREAVTWKHLVHPSLLPFLGVCCIPQHLEHGFISTVSPWRGNGSVGIYLRAGNSLPDKQKSLHQLASGVHYLHDENVVHGDLTDNNILLTDEYDIQICDFGLWKWIETTSSTGGSRAAGTSRYMAPELFGFGDSEPTKVSPASDVFAFACLAFEIYTGTVPLAQYNNTNVSYKVYKGERSARPSVPMIPNDLWDLIGACWNQDATARPSMEEVISRMEGWGRPPRFSPFLSPRSLLLT
ncbi:kinase-like domain-containing protein [Mycena polygramma]|nr:kinase-like domain-containing protein [Mycena polygramma]KAJ7648574.1 kinase-like domain-containing protein [Mycena polygramma]